MRRAAVTDDSTNPGDAFSIPADPDVIDGDANDDGQSDIGNADPADDSGDNSEGPVIK